MWIDAARWAGEDGDMKNIRWGMVAWGMYAVVVGGTPGAVAVALLVGMAHDRIRGA